jgi:hypothetical protein
VFGPERIAKQSALQRTASFWPQSLVSLCFCSLIFISAFNSEKNRSFMQGKDLRGPHRQDTFDLRDQITPDSSQTQMQAHADAAAGHYDVYAGAEDEEGYSIMEHDSDGEEHDDGMYEGSMSSELSIPDESINFDLVYSLHSFAATVEGQANVVKGDSLILMDDSNSYWWLVKVLKTQEVGYIPAENIETPFERLARLNKHRNVDVCLYPPVFFFRCTGPDQIFIVGIRD